MQDSDILHFVVRARGRRLGENKRFYRLTRTWYRDFIQCNDGRVFSLSMSLRGAKRRSNLVVIRRIAAENRLGIVASVSACGGDCRGTFVPRNDGRVFPLSMSLRRATRRSNREAIRRIAAENRLGIVASVSACGGDCRGTFVPRNDGRVFPLSMSLRRATRRSNREAIRRIAAENRLGIVASVSACGGDCRGTFVPRNDGRAFSLTVEIATAHLRRA